MKNILKHPVYLLIISLMSLVLCNSGYGSTRMPPFSLEEVRTGKLAQSKEFEGKVLLVSFFATWCPPCVEEVPVLVGLQKKFGDAGFSVVALSVDRQGAEPVVRFIEKHGINYPVLLADAKVSMDFGGVYGIPTAFLVNRSGNVVKRYTGYVDPSVLTRDIKSLL